MSNDFPFNHFISNNSSKNNNLDIEIVKDYEFETVNDPQSSLSSNFNTEELRLIESEVLSSIKSTISTEKYTAFFENTFQISNITDKEILFSTTTSFIKRMVESQYIDDLKAIILDTLGKSYEIRLEVLNKQEKTVKKEDSTTDNFLADLLSGKGIQEEKKSVQPNSVKRTSFKINDISPKPSTQEEIKDQVDSAVIKYNTQSYFGNRIDTSKIFDNFIVGPSNNMAYAFSQAVGKDPGKVYPQLYIHGNSGLGKTHLLHAICNHVNNSKPHLRICFTTANDFMSEMVMAIQSTTGSSNKISEFRRKYTELVDVLIIDDIHELKNKTRTQSEFFYIFNELQSKGKQLIFTSDKAPKEIVGIEDRIRTRLSSALLIDIQLPDLETRIAILKKKAGEKDIVLDDEVINLIASCIKNNVRELEGNLVKLGAYSDLMNVDIDLEIAKEQLNLDENMDEKILTIESISKSVASYFKLAIGDIKGKTRKKEVAMARHIAMYMSHKILKKTLEEIGEYFDNRDHSTVIHGIKKIQTLIKDNSKTSQQIYEIESRL